MKSELLPQLRHHSAWLTRAIADVDWLRATFRLAPGPRPSIAWLVGHIAEGVDSIATAVADCGPFLDPAFSGRREQRDWGLKSPPEWEALRESWERVAQGTLAGLEELGEDALDLAPAIEIHPEFRERLSTRRAFLAGECFHVAYHLGQIGTLRAAQGLGW